MWLSLSALAFILGLNVNLPFLVSAISLWLMGIIYNVEPLRTKDIPVLDVLSESVNNAIRLLAGWFIISADTLPPCSIILGYWMGGAFLMAVKRYAEYKMINNPKLAGKYRKILAGQFILLRYVCSLLHRNFLNQIQSRTRNFCASYDWPVLLLFHYYFTLSFKNDSAVQKPEKLYHERGLMIYCAILILVFALLMVINIPALRIFTGSELIRL